MFRTTFLAASTGITAACAAVLLYGQLGTPTATPDHPTVKRGIEPAAFSFSQLYPFVVGAGTPTSSNGTAGVVAIASDAVVAANGALQSANQLGPLTFDLNSIRAISANQAPPGTNAATANYTNMDQWVTGIAGLASSTGALGFAENGTAYDPFVGTHTGVLQTANTFGPMFFNLNVLKAIGLTQAPSGTLLASGQPDNYSAVDIGRWSAGIPGVITQTGTTGFVTYQDFGAGPIADYRVGGLHTTTNVGGQTFDFNVLPSISTGIIPPSFSFAMSPDMTAANTPFAPFSPPTPGVVQPFGGLPAPAPVVTPFARSAAPADPVAATEAPAVSEAKPTAVIPGVNGIPPGRTPATVPPLPGTSGASGGGQFDPWKPLKPITDAFGAFTGTKPDTGAAGAGPDGGGGGDGAGNP